ncbi:MAG: hypothetical protein AB7O37_21960 [Vicinamibacteria bacterium]
MRDLEVLDAKQVRIFAVDALPIDRLGLASAALRERFNWDKGEVQADGDLLLQGGASPAKGDPNAVIIRTLQLGSRRIVLSVVGDTRDADRIYSELIEVLVSATGRESWRAQPVLKVHETAAVVTLDVDPRALIAPALLSFVDQAGNQLSLEKVRAWWREFSLSFKFSYDLETHDLKEYSTTVSDKLLTIEPRSGLPLDGRRYFTKSPVDTDTHRALLEDLERRLTAQAR